MNKIKICTLLLILFVQGIHTQAFWKQLPTSNVGGLRVHALSRCAYPVIYAGTEGGFFRSNAAQDYWERKIIGLKNRDVRAIADRLYPAGYLFIGTQGGGIYRSTNSGNSWTEVNTGLNHLNISAIQILYDWTVVAATSGGLYRSNDLGGHWTLIQSGPAVPVASLIVDDNDILIAGTESEGVYISQDSAKTWHQRNNGLTEKFVRAIAKTWDDQIFAGGPSGVYRSMDFGANWVSLSAGLPDLNILSLGIVASSLYAGTESGVYGRVPTAPDWIAINTGAPMKRVSVIHSYYAGTEGSGVFRNWDKNGWTDLSFGLTPNFQKLYVNESNQLFASTVNFGIFRSSDQGNSWVEINEGITENQRLTFAFKKPNTLFIGTEGNAYRSTDNGDSWQPLSQRFFNIAILNDGNIYVTPTDNMLYISTNNGNEWIPRNISATILNLATDGNNTLFACVSRFGILSSTDSGKTWNQFGLNARNVSLLERTNSGHYFAFGSVSTNTFCTRRDDDGINWTKMPFLFKQIVSSKDGIVYAATMTLAVQKSHDSGKTWISFNDGLPYAATNSIAIDSTGFLYVSAGKTIYRSTISTGVSSKNEIVPTGFMVSQNYPNPFNPTTTITYNLPTSSNVSLVVYDYLGREVKIVMNNYQYQGIHDVVFDGAGLASGVYFYKIIAGNYTSVKKMAILR